MTEPTTTDSVQVVKQEERNGVVRPKPETACGRIWAEADNMSASVGGPVACADLIAKLTPQGYVEPTIRTQYARWRKFYNVTGRVVSANKAAEEAAKEAAKVAKKEAAEAAKLAKAQAKEAKQAEREAKKAEADQLKAQKAAERAEAKAAKDAEKAAKAEQAAKDKADKEAAKQAQGGAE